MKSLHGPVSRLVRLITACAFVVSLAVVGRSQADPTADHDAPVSVPVLTVDAPKLDSDTGIRDDEAFHAASIVVDMHADTTWRLGSSGANVSLSSVRAGPSKLKAGGVDAQFFALWVPPDSQDPAGDIAKQLAAYQKRLVGDQSVLVPARSSAEIIRISESGRVAALLGLEGCTALQGKHSMLREFAELGVMYVSLTWNETNAFGEGCNGKGRAGATEKGLELIRLANELRVIPDVSHTSDATFWDVVTESARPVIASHSNAAVVWDNVRNLDDLQLRAIAESGGVVGLNFYSNFVSGRRPVADMGDLLAHARHMRAVMGPGHIGLGSDFDGTRRCVAGLEDSSKIGALTTALRADGWADDEIRGLLGQNMLRVLDETGTGTAERMVTHRPAKVMRAVAISGGQGIDLMVDRNMTTAWQPEDSVVDQSIRLTVEGPGVERIAVTSASPGVASGGFRLLVQGICDGRPVSDAVGLEVGTELRAYRVEIPLLADCAWPEVDVWPALGGDASKTLRISELTVEMR